MSIVNFYKIVCNDSGAIYIGSTCSSIEKRLRSHEYNYKQYLKNKYHFITAFSILEKNNYNIYLIDSIECVDKKQRDIIETLYILNENGINRNHPGRDIKQRYNDNKEKLNEYSRKYYQENKEKQQQKFNCLCGGKYTLEHKSSHMKTKKHKAYENNN